ncbi:MAG: DNA-protecting protein DprA [Parcubacteria group bacterium]|nr:DNA-protecting protein DprA [Parcubacteria group bacterium]
MDLLYLNAINIVFGLQRIRKLLKTFGSAERAWQAPAGRILELGFDTESIKAALKKKESLDPQAEWQKLEAQNIKIISFGDKNYPTLLKETASPPLLLYLRGNGDLLKEKSLAVVGTRAPSSYGRLAVDILIPHLAEAGLTIVSGLAQGIDALVHGATLKANGLTIAVLGSGVDHIYPAMNLPLANDILNKNGLIMSEFPLGTRALKQNFPARNRIIAGLSLGTVVIESKIAGGALITARHALENNREVFALPGPINLPTAAGTNRLIQQGAKVVLAASDILEELNIKELSAKEKLVLSLDKLSGEEKTIVEFVQKEPAHIDKIIQTVKLNPQAVTAVLTQLELKGIVKNMGGQIYTIC